MHARHGFAVVLLFFWAVLLCAAQIENGDHVIIGTVRDGNSHEPLEGVRVRLVVGGELLAAMPTTSSTDGQFQLGCRKGDFYILADKSGYVPAQVKVSIGPGQETDVTIELQRQPPQGPSNADPNEAISAHQLSVPSKAREAYEQGTTLLNSKKDYAGAVALFESAIRDYPSYYEAYAEMGVAQYYRGDSQAAEEALRKSIALSSGKYPYAIVDLAELLNSTKRFADAEPLARQAIAVENSSWRGYFELARAQFGLDHPADAEESAAKAHDLNPDYPVVYLVLTDIHLALHNYSSVLQDADAYLKLVPKGPTSDQVRKMRLQVRRALERAQAQSATLPRP
jgi:Carboxypeptidase regulatory-like domain